MKKIICTILFCLLHSILVRAANDYRVEVLYHAAGVTIGDVPVYKGQFFSETDVIKWGKNEEAALIVKEISTNKLYRFSKRQFESKGQINTIKDFFLRTNKTSTRDVGDEAFVKVKTCKDRFSFKERRIALVIGNSTYTYLRSLQNPQSDAISLTDKLLTIGFDVVETFDCNEQEFYSVLSQFEKIVEGYDVVFFYYAGHGVQKDGKNYLVPVNGKLQNPSDIHHFVACDDVLLSLERTSCHSRVIIFDACRKISSALSDGVYTGLTEMHKLSPGTMLIYSTGFGEVAGDGDENQNHSPFVLALLSNIGKPSVSFETEMKNVAKETYRLTSKQQFPAISGTILEPLILNPRAAVVTKTQILIDKGEQAYNANKYSLARNYLKKAAKLGDMEGYYLLGELYEFDFENMDKAVKYYLKAAENGHSDAQNKLGNMCYYGYGVVSQDYFEAVKWFTRSAEQGNATAQYNLGHCYENGYGVSKDTVEAVKWFRKAAEQDDANAQNILGVCYNIGRGVSRDTVEAVKWWRKAAEQGNVHAQNRLGLCYELGHGVSQDSIEAVKWYRKAAEQGNVYAQYNLGRYYYGKNVSQDSVEAVKWFRKAAEQDHADAQNYLGVCYESGHGVSRDSVEAVKWISKAAEQGNVFAQCNLGEYYYYGKYVLQDSVEAVKWFRRAAEQGYTIAQYNLGVCYELGYGVPKDSVEAVKWYRKAAEQGFAEAQYNLGVCYENGIGVPKDIVNAVKWYRKAAEQGNEDAKNRLEELERKKH